MKNFKCMNMLAIAAVSLSVLGSFSALNANAAVQMGWEKPFLKATMTVENTTGEFADLNDITLTLTRQEGRKTATGIMLMVEDRPMYFDINEEPNEDACGTLVYIGHPTASQALMARQSKVQLVIKDHQNRFCKDFVPARWEAVLKHTDVMGDAELGQMKMSGNPEPIITIQ